MGMFFVLGKQGTVTWGIVVPAPAFAQEPESYSICPVIGKPSLQATAALEHKSE